MHTARSFVNIAMLAGALVPAASAQGNRSAVDAAGRYEATIRRTSYGIPHIVAADLAGLGFGEGYAQAEDHGNNALEPIDGGSVAAGSAPMPRELT